MPVKLLVIVLNETEYLDDILTLFLELGVTGATVIDTVGMGRIVAKEIPIFAGFKDLLSGSFPSNKTIFTVIEDKLIDEVVDGIEKSIGDFRKTGKGIFFTIPLDRVWGLAGDFDDKDG